MKILVVDDDHEILEETVELLRGDGYEVISAESCEGALKIVQPLLEAQESFIALLDWKMRFGMNGLNLRDILKQDGYPLVPVIMMTGMSAAPSVRELLEADADAYLLKPLNPESLEKKIKKAEEIISSHHRDHLGLLNKATIIRKIVGLVAYARRAGLSLSLLYIDMDDFGRVNKEYGHSVGDLVIAEFVKRMCKFITRDTDFAGRMGGDEFLLVSLTGKQGSEEASRLAEKILRNINADPKICPGTKAKVPTASIGVVTIVPKKGGIKTEDIARKGIIAADEALLRAKKTKNAFEVAS